MAGVEKQDKDEDQSPFVFRYPSNGMVYELKVPVKIPYTRDVRELAVRLIRGHDLPCYLEDQLIDQLRCHVQETTQLASDSNATETMQRVLDEDKVTDTTDGVLLCKTLYLQLAICKLHCMLHALLLCWLF